MGFIAILTQEFWQTKELSKNHMSQGYRGMLQRHVQLFLHIRSLGQTIFETHVKNASKRKSRCNCFLHRWLGRSQPVFTHVVFT